MAPPPATPARRRAHPSARCTTQPPEASAEALTSPFCIELQGLGAALVRWGVELGRYCCHQVAGVFPQDSADWVRAITERPDEEWRGGGEWEKGHKTHLLGPRGSSKMPLVYVRPFPSSASPRDGSFLSPSMHLGGSGRPCPASQAGTGLLAPPSHSPAGLGITGNLGSNPVLPRPSPCRVSA